MLLFLNQHLNPNQLNMKTIYAFLFLFLAFIMQAQVTFNPGIRAGLNLAKFTENDSGIYNWFEYDPYYDSTQKAEMSFLPSFYVGFQGNIRFAKMYALQPEFNLSMQGSKVKVGSEEYEPKITYLSFQVVNKFYFEKFNMHIGPSIDVVLDSKNIEPWNSTDLEFLAGLGYDFTPNLGAEARIKKGIVSVANSNGEDHTNVLVQLGLYYSFPKK